jgi:hypothetical protein
MSHSVNIKTEFKNIINLLGQFTSRGWRIEQNTKCNTYPSDPRRDEIHRYVAKNPKNQYDIGINVDKQGMATFVCDFYDKTIEQQLGKNLQNIKQGYALQEVKDFMAEQDMHYQIEELATGELVVIAEK